MISKVDLKSVKIKEIDYESEELPEALELYEATFPPPQHGNPTSWILGLIKNEPEKYKVHIAKMEDRVVGYEFTLLLDSHQKEPSYAGFTEYIGVEESLRGHGIGTKLFEQVKSNVMDKLYAQWKREGGTEPYGLIFEIDRPDAEEASVREEEEMVQEFHRKLGAKKFGCIYLQPLGEGKELSKRTDEQNLDRYMDLLINPFREDFSSIPKETMLGYIDDVYKTIYRYYAPNLLRITEMYMPENVRLFDIKPRIRKPI